MPPEYFERIAANSQELWDELEARPDLAGPWRQLFSQVQSPRHVLSEMLQNADDAGATWVDVSVSNDHFAFEHNGRDFEESELASLCRFGYSNKRSLHTIGFRGIGFKSLFSIGPNVCLTTPSLSIRFEARRFTQPLWSSGSTLPDRTRIEVAIQDQNRRHELVKNFEQWRSSPLSLLFFNSVRKLRIQGHLIEKESLSDGPCQNSKWVRLIGSKYERLLHIRSAEAEFPDEAIEEIKQERNTNDLNLPPCRVEIVLGEQEQCRLFVVLPTGVHPNLPFSCHAPFLQDPARFGIKDPATSPTNLWLLDRVGRLAADTMVAWLDNRSLSREQRAEAYGLLPPPKTLGDSLSASVTECVSMGFRLGSNEKPVLLADDGELAFPPHCVAVPPEISRVWSSSQLDQIFSLDGSPCLSAVVDDGHRHQLEAWDWIENISSKEVIEILIEKPSVPKPTSLGAIAALWAFTRRTKFRPYNDSWKAEVSIVPVQGADELRPASKLVRLSSRRTDIPDSEWEFLSSFVQVIDSQWIDGIRDANNDTSGSSVLNTWFADSSALLKELSLDSPTTTDRLMALVCNNAIFGRVPDAQLLVRITHLFAALDATVPERFPYVNRLGKSVCAADGITFDAGSLLEDILPEKFCQTHIIHDDYDRQPIACTRQQWRAWAASQKSRLSALSILDSRRYYINTRPGLEEFLASVGKPPPAEYQYKSGTFQIDDTEIENTVFEHLAYNKSSTNDAWVKLLKVLLSGPSEHWQGQLYANVREVAANGHSRKARTEPVPAKWIRQLAAQPCLPDTYDRPCVPADLLLRTPDTEPLLGIDSFVSADLDTPQARPLLLMLGARDTSTGTDRIVDRVRALAESDDPPIHELGRWYEALDRAAARAKPDELAVLRKTFATQPLIRTNDGHWSRSAEVFCFADAETMPDAPTIHASFDSLPLWKRLGVADRPTLELVIAWLTGLPTDSKLPSDTARRVQACLKSFPAQIHDQLGLWLSLDHRWMPVDSFRFKHCHGTNLRIADLFVAAKSHTADLRGVSMDRLDDRFGHVTDLSSAIEFKVSEILQPRTVGPAPDWLIALGTALERLVHIEADVQQRVRELGRRMHQSVWQPVTSLQVTPYLESAPVGQPLRPSILWAESTLFVRDAPLVEIIEELVGELQRPFEMPTIAEAIRICIDRPSRFIQQYLESKFELEPIAEPAPQVNSKEPIESTSDSIETPNQAEGNEWQFPLMDETNAAANSQPSNNGNSLTLGSNDLATNAASPEDETVLENEDDAAEPPTDDAHVVSEETSPRPDVIQSHGESQSNGKPQVEPSEKKPSDPAKRPLVERYAEMLGLTFLESRNAYFKGDGTRMLKSSGTFGYEFYDASGRLTRQVWMTTQSLPAGLEVPAEVWELIKSSPETTAIVCEGHHDQIVELTGTELRQMLDQETLQLFPAKYRLKQIAEVELANEGTPTN
ncbi:MAG: sacsin N-terminal ATP-binding-like domain-containing protein [Aureliella sp.]